MTRQEADGIAFVAKVVAPGSELYADEAGHWDALLAKCQASRIDGACTNRRKAL